MQENTYILEKCWRIQSSDFRFDKDKFDIALVRPSNVSYQTYRDFSLGKKTKCNSIIHEGCIAYWYADGTGKSSTSYEEFIIDANVNKQAFPEFECWQFTLNLNFQTYTVRVIDLKTGEVLYDHLDKWLSENTHRHLI